VLDSIRPRQIFVVIRSFLRQTQGQRDARRLETVAVALLTSLTFPPGALFDRLRRALYPDENSTATRKIGQIVATSRCVAATPSARPRLEAGADDPSEHPRRNRVPGRRCAAQTSACRHGSTPRHGWAVGAPANSALTPAPTAPQCVHTIRGPNDRRAFGPAISADLVHCAALVSMLNSLRSFACRDETLGQARIEGGAVMGNLFLGIALAVLVAQPLLAADYPPPPIPPAAVPFDWGGNLFWNRGRWSHRKIQPDQPPCPPEYIARLQSGWRPGRRHHRLEQPSILGLRLFQHRVGDRG
jgi:hypothetical protein